MEEEIITTDVDEIIDVLKQNERIELNELAEKTGLSVDIVGEWARLLEEQNLARIEQGITRSYVIWNGETKTAPDSAHQKKKSKGKNAEENVLLEKKTIPIELPEEAIITEADISRLREVKSEIEKTLIRSTSRIGKTTETLERIESELEEYVKNAKSKVKEKSGNVKKLEQLVEKMKGIDEEVKARLETARGRAAEKMAAATEIEEMLNEANRADAEINEAIENAKAKLKEETRQVSLLENELAELKKVDGWMKEYKAEYEQKFGEFSKYVQQQEGNFKRLKKTIDENTGGGDLEDLARVVSQGGMLETEEENGKEKQAKNKAGGVHDEAQARVEKTLEKLAKEEIGLKTNAEKTGKGIEKKDAKKARGEEAGKRDSKKAKTGDRANVEKALERFVKKERKEKHGQGEDAAKEIDFAEAYAHIEKTLENFAKEDGGKAERELINVTVDEAQAHIEEALKKIKAENGNVEDEFIALFKNRKKKSGN